MTRVSLGIALFVLVVGAVLVVRGHDPSVVDRSLGKLGDDKRFTTSARAAQTVADISADLRRAGAECRPKGGRRCTVLLQASAYSAVTAYTLADCTAPGVYDGRKVMQRYLRAVRDFFHGATPPRVPEVITC